MLEKSDKYRTEKKRTSTKVIVNIKGTINKTKRKDKEKRRKGYRMGNSMSKT